MGDQFRFRFRHRQDGGHVHVRVFTGPESGTLSKAGDLTFRPEEWRAFVSRLEAKIVGQSVPVFDVVEDD